MVGGGDTNICDGRQQIHEGFLRWRIPFDHAVPAEMAMQFTVTGSWLEAEAVVSAPVSNPSCNLRCFLVHVEVCMLQEKRFFSLLCTEEDDIQSQTNRERSSTFTLLHHV